MYWGVRIENAVILCISIDPDEVRALLTNGLYLEDQAVLIDGFKFYG